MCISIRAEVNFKWYTFAPNSLDVCFITWSAVVTIDHMLFAILRF